VGWAKPARVQPTRAVAHSPTTSRPCPNPNPRALATPWSPPSSPIFPGRFRPSPPARWGASAPPLDGAPDHRRRSGPSRSLCRSPSRSPSLCCGALRRLWCDGAVEAFAAVVRGAAALGGAWPGLARCRRAFDAHRRGRHGCGSCLLAPGTPLPIPSFLSLWPALLLPPVALLRLTHCVCVCCFAAALVLVLLCCSCGSASLALIMVAMAMPELAFLLCYPFLA
jgi:hypothetical protein